MLYDKQPASQKALEVTQYILERGARTMTELMKLLYYSQASSLVKRNQTLFPDPICAWQHGPVVPAVWEHVKHMRGGVVANLSAEERTVIDSVLTTYGRLRAAQLTRLSHSEAPWADARNGLPAHARSTRIIEPCAIRKFYSQPGKLL